MSDKYERKFRLAYLNTQRTNNNFQIAIMDESIEHYGSYCAAEDEFDSEDEAIEHALNSEDWKFRSDFIVIPFFRKRNLF